MQNLFDATTVQHRKDPRVQGHRSNPDTVSAGSPMLDCAGVCVRLKSSARSIGRCLAPHVSQSGWIQRGYSYENAVRSSRERLIPK